MKKLCLVVAALAIALAFQVDVHAAVNAISQSANGMVVIPSKNGIALKATSQGRACGMINGAVVAADPAAACNNVNGPISPNRSINFTDAAGNNVAARAGKIAVPGFIKFYFTRANTVSVNANTFSFAEFADPIFVSDPDNGAFDVDVTRSFMSVYDSDLGMTINGLELGGSSGLDNAQFHAEMSSNLTGFLFSLDLFFSADQPLGVVVTLGAVAGQPGWDQQALESDLRALLDAGNPDNDFSLSAFSFPDIRIHVNAGESLELFSTDRSVVTVPEPPTVELLAISAFVLGVIHLTRVRGFSALAQSAEW